MDRDLKRIRLTGQDGRPDMKERVDARVAELWFRGLSFDETLSYREGVEQALAEDDRRSII